MINRVVLVGRITADPEVRKTQSGLSVCTFTVAMNRRTNREVSDFVRCTAWRQTADFMGQYITKGALIGVEGSLQSGSYEDKETGKRINTLEVSCDSVQALESRSSRQQASQNSGQPAYSQPSSTYNQKDDFQDEFDDGEPVLDITSDDLPF